MQMDFSAPRTARPMPNLLVLVLLVGGILLSSECATAQQNASVAISVKDHHFQPGQISAPANRPLSITVKNLDTTPMEFESVSLRVEKVIPPGSEGTVHVRALAPGQYEFFDDFHQETRGTLIVQ
jgi:hypothetical protein